MFEQSGRVDHQFRGNRDDPLGGGKVGSKGKGKDIISGLAILYRSFDATDMREDAIDRVLCKVVKVFFLSHDIS